VHQAVLERTPKDHLAPARLVGIVIGVIRAIRRIRQMDFRESPDASPGADGRDLLELCRTDAIF
jgi:hypothetical protein